MALREVDHLLIGGGIAAGNCAEALREGDSDASILLVGREADPPYNRPPLSKAYLRGEKEREDAHLQPPEWWKEQRIELLTSTSVMKLDSVERTVTLSNKDEVRFDKALLATGANVRRLRAEGGDLEGIHYLRAFGNSDAIRADAEAADRAVLVGGSYIGCEVAASLTAGLDVQCTIVMQEDTTFDRVFGAEVGGYFQRVLTDHGVRVVGGDQLERFEGSDGRVGRVVTAAGEALECDLVVIGVGVMPDVMLARAAGLELGETGGVRCSSRLETSAPGIYAAGDICEFDAEFLGEPLRAEHWDVARTQGAAAAKNMLGADEAYTTLPYFFSDLADWASLEYVGHGSGDAVIRGSVDRGDFTAFYTEEGRITAALTLERSDDIEHARRWIAAGARPDPAALADEGADLADL